MSVIHVTTDTFESQVLKSDVPVVVDFWAPWCGPCRMIGPVLDELSEQWEGKVRVVKVNVDNEPGLAQRFQVRGIPSLLAVAGGEVVANQVGFRGRGDLERLFEAAAGQDIRRVG